MYDFNQRAGGVGCAADTSGVVKQSFASEARWNVRDRSGQGGGSCCLLNPFLPSENLPQDIIDSLLAEEEGDVGDMLQKFNLLNIMHFDSTEDKMEAAVEAVEKIKATKTPFKRGGILLTSSETTTDQIRDDFMSAYNCFYVPWKSGAWTWLYLMLMNCH